MANAVGLWLPTNPRSLKPAPPAPDIFDHDPKRNLGQPGIANHCSTPEWDNLFIATAVELGCPRWAAEQARTHPPARFALARVWSDVKEAAAGDREAKERCDYYKHCFQELRREELISDKPAAEGNVLAASKG